MLPTRYSKYITYFIRNNRLRRAFIGLFFISLLLAVEVFGELHSEIYVIAFLFVAVLYLDVIENQLISVIGDVKSINERSNELEENLVEVKQHTNEIGNHVSSASVYNHEDSLAPKMDQLISETDPDYVFMLDYSSKKGEYIIDEARKHDAEVYLLIKNPDTAVRNYQRERIIGQITHSLFSMFSEYDNLYVGLYGETGSVRARLIGNSCVTVGWYRYECIDTMASERIWGHNNPTFLFTQDDKSFDDVSRWVREDVLAMHWENSTDLQTLYNAGNLPEINEWVNTNSESEREKEKKEQYIKKTSGAAEKAQQKLFD